MQAHQGMDMPLFDQLAKRESRIQAAFEAYHAEHPEVFELFRKFALEAKQSGREAFGAKAIFERIRWHYMVNNKAGEEFKVNNNFTSRYVRLLEETDPQFIGFFKKRKLTSENQKG